MKRNSKFFASFCIATMVLGTVIALNLNDKSFVLGEASKDYTITFNSNVNKILDIKQPLPDLSQNEEALYYGESGKFNVTTQDGYKDLTFYAKGAFKYSEGVIGLGVGGCLGNFYNKTDPYHGRINGIKSIVVNYTGGPLDIAYSFEQDMEKGEYYKTSIPLPTNTVYDFNNTYPSYFLIHTEIMDLTLIQDITLTYSCNLQDTLRPTTAHYDGGYDVGAVTNEVFSKTAYSNCELGNYIEEAIAKHYRYIDVTCDYDNIEPYETVLNYRRDFSHAFAYPKRGTEYSQVQGCVNSFEIIYSGDTSVNNDTYFVPTENENERGYGAHFDVASFYNNVTPENTHQAFVNAPTLIRNKYFKDNNLLRPKDFNNFAVDKLTDDKLFDVYNSEDLWWALEQGYKPNFVRPNSKAEWIYNQAKDILKEIIIETMTPYEKALAIYEWIIDNNQYDDDALNTSRTIEENVCFFLEGVFERRIGVCDSFSKTFVLLGKIEGLDVIRGVGFGDYGGHAWGYFRENDTQDYYLVCPTWGDSLVRFPDISFNYLSYAAFMGSKNLFTDINADISFYDFRNENKPLSSQAYPTSYMQLNKLPGHPSYDYSIDSKEEMVEVIKRAYQACDNSSFTLPLMINNEEILSSYGDICVEAGVDTVKYTGYYFDTSAPYYGDYKTFCFQLR